MPVTEFKIPPLNLNLTRDDQKLLALKDIHLGRRAFLLGNGPSVRADDLERMANELTFAANRFYMAYEQFKLTMRPTYTACVDLLVLENHGHEIAARCGTPLFVSGRFAKIEQYRTDNMIVMREIPPPFSENPADFFFSDNLLKVVGQGYGVIYTMIQLAAWMGIRRMLLYGIDHNFSLPKDYVKPGVKVTHGGEDNHFIANYRDQGEKWAPPNPPRIEAGFWQARQYCESHGIEIYNCTRGGRLEVLERRSLDEELAHEFVPVPIPIQRSNPEDPTEPASFVVSPAQQIQARRGDLERSGPVGQPVVPATLANQLRGQYHHWVPVEQRLRLRQLRQQTFGLVRTGYRTFVPLPARLWLRRVRLKLVGQKISSMPGTKRPANPTSGPPASTTAKTANEVALPSPHPKPPVARRLDAAYLAKRDALIQSLIERVRQNEDLDKVLQGFTGRDFDERVVEYPYFVHWLLQQEQGLDLLDVGFVLNNKLVSNTLLERCGRVWLCNVIREPEIFVCNPVTYLEATLEQACPGGEKFPLVTCLSTIEHIGYDNSQYGSAEPGKYTQPALEPLVESLQKLAALLAPGGNLLVSVPFGYRETLVHPGTGKIVSQVFDFAALQQGVARLGQAGVTAEIEVFAATATGWELTEGRTFSGRYADGCPAACAVAFIKGKKEGR